MRTEDNWTETALLVADGGGDLEEAAYSDWEPVRFAAAGRADLPDEQVRTLASDPSPSVRAAVAARPDLDPDLLDQLAVDEEPCVLRALAARPNLPGDARARLSRSLDAGVLRALDETRAADLLESMPAPPLRTARRRLFGR